MISLRSALLGCVVASAVLVDVNAQTVTNTNPTNAVQSSGDNLSSYSSQVVSYAANLEDLYFSGTGTTASTPLVGVVVDGPSGGLVNPSGGTSGAAQAAINSFATQLNGLFEYSITSLSNVNCCYASSGTCTPSSAFTLAPGTTLQYDTTVAATCTWASSPPNSVLYVQVVSVSSAAPPIKGQIEWLVDGPALNPDLTTLASPTSITIPLLSSLKIDPAFLTGTSTDDNFQTWLAVDTSSNQAEIVSNTPGYVAFNPAASSGVATTQLGTNNVPATVIDKIVGCSIQTGTTIGTGAPIFVTVNDATSWAAPTAPNTKYEYYPVCYFHAVSVTGYGTANEVVQESVVVSAQLHLVILAPCDPTSGTSYSPDVVSKALSSYWNDGSPISGSGNTVDVSVGLQASTSSVTVQITTETLSDGVTPGASFPFYQLLTASDPQSNGIDLNPIGTYLSITADGTSVYNGDTADYYSPDHPVTTISQTNPSDQNLPFLCWDLPFLQTCHGHGSASVCTTSTTQLDTSQASPLVNDKTVFAAGIHTISCHIFDKLGYSNQETITLNVLAPITPPGGGGGGCHSGHTNAGSACGDPQFSGFLGQSFQVHGVSGQIYNVLSTPSFQYNALFTYLTSGSCRSGTQCFAHAGNYFGAVGMLFRTAAGVKSVQVQSGSVNVGLTVTIDGVAMTVSSTAVSVGDGVTLTLATPFELEVYTPEFSLKLSNSDMFINQDVAINSPLLRRIQLFKQASKSNNASAAADIAATLPHGLLGQTHQYKTYANRWKYIEGSLFDYSVADGLTGTEFKYNRF